MANLSEATKDEIWALIMQAFSRRGITIPVLKNQLRTFVDIIDNELESSEVSIVQAIPAGVGRDWVIANPDVAREILEFVAKKRRLEL